MSGGESAGGRNKAEQDAGDTWSDYDGNRMEGLRENWHESKQPGDEWAGLLAFWRTRNLGQKNNNCKGPDVGMLGRTV